ncbi:MAG: hypothetical protein M3P08_14370 [Thermoproteota archaeon]|nr:hypothetical protein [Thermoproteota archaeon]
MVLLPAVGWVDGDVGLTVMVTLAMLLSIPRPSVDLLTHECGCEAVPSSEADITKLILS